MLKMESEEVSLAKREKLLDRDMEDLVEYVKVSKALPSPPILLEIPLQPQEQLSIVLPLESWSLIRNPRLRGIPALAPAFWPRKFEFMSLGKRMMWECPPRIPILTPARLRALLV